jgi:amidase
MALPGMLTNFDIAVLGPLARSATDLDLELDIMAGPDPDDGGYSKIVLPRWRRPNQAIPRRYRLATQPRS